MSKDRFLKPGELLEANPVLKEFWTAQQLGYLLMSKVVEGKKLTRSCLLSERSVLKLYNFIKTT